MRFFVKSFTAHKRCGLILHHFPVNPAQATVLRTMLESTQVAALATLHKNEPAVSMVPYALLPQGQGLLIHVSRLATHTADMLATPAVALLLVATQSAGTSAQELGRASIKGHAQRLAGGSPEYLEGQRHYLLKFPHAEELFGFADFSLFAIAVQSVRFVGGFAQATTVPGKQFSSIMGGGMS